MDDLHGERQTNQMQKDDRCMLLIKNGMLKNTCTGVQLSSGCGPAHERRDGANDSSHPCVCNADHLQWCVHSRIKHYVGSAQSRRRCIGLHGDIVSLRTSFPREGYGYQLLLFTMLMLMPEVPVAGSLLIILSGSQGTEREALDLV